MIKILILTVTLIGCTTTKKLNMCPMTVVNTQTDRPWDKMDDDILSKAHDSCLKNTRSPCAETLFRYDNRRFHLDCGSGKR